MTNDDVKRIKIHFRNYIPSDPSLEKYMIQDSNVSTNSIIVQDLGGGLSYAGKLLSHLEERLKQAAANVDQVKIAPRKVNWDLKRDASRSLNKLNRQTQRAILALAEEQRAQEDSDDEEDGSTDGSEEESDT